MKSIAEAIFDLLYVRDTVVVPGLGAFVKKPTSAQVNPVANYFTAPSCVVEFDDDLREDNDLIINYVAGENDIPVDEAKRLLVIFVSDCFNKLKNGEKVVLSGIGTLRYDWHSDIVLEQDTVSNFNSDAFGLSDFTAVPVVHSKTKDEIRAEIEQQQKDKNTPVTVDEKAVHEGDRAEDEEVDDHDEYYDYDDYRPRRLVWPWVLLALLLLIGLVLGHQYFGLYNFKKWFIPKAPVIKVVDTIKKPVTPVEVDSIQLTDTIEKVKEDTVQIAVEQPTENVLPVEEEGKILVVAGCFSSEVNAQNMVAKLKEEGHREAVVEKHGSKWFVAYGRYRTDAEALEALHLLKAEGNDKAWIRK